MNKDEFENRLLNAINDKKQPIYKYINIKQDQSGWSLLMLTIWFVLFWNFSDNRYDLYDAIMKYLLG